MLMEHRIAMVFFMIFIIGVVILLIVSKGNGSTKRIRDFKSKNQLMKDNKYIKENEERISKLFDEKYNDLEPLKRKLIYCLILGIIIIISVFLIKNELYTYVSIGIIIILSSICLYQYSSKSNEDFNEMVIEILHDYDKDLVYLPGDGFYKEEYYECRFPETCDRYHSEDMIINDKKGFYFADILVESEYEDEDGHTHITVEYSGSLAKIMIKNMNCKIFLGGMKTYLFSGDDYVKLDLENEEFNQYFSAYTDNELMAYKILTPDVMEEFVNIKKSSYGDIDIRIINDKLYIRFLSGNGFDNALTKNGDKKSLCKSIAVLEEVIYTMDKVKKVIENKDME